jgi:inorganic pyrophosphatase
MTTERPDAGDAATGADSLMCVVEIAKGSRNKYEYDRELGVIVFDRFLSSSVVYPTDYGFIADTLALDGDELDVLVCVTEPTFPGCRLPVRPVGMLIMRDEHGIDNKIVTVPVSDPNWAECQNLDDVPRQLRAEIFHFFSVYKDLDADRFAEPTGWADRDAAQDEIHQALERRRQS